MRILVTNDDGVEAPGLRALAHTLVADGHEVVVVAPDGERSGAGAAIGWLHRSGPISHQDVDWPDLPGVAVHALGSQPATTVYAAWFGAFGPRPELVASGVNRGLNTGHLVLHSGTVGAALTAAVLDLPAIAVSLAWGDDEHWDTAARLAAAAVASLRDAPGTVLSLNVPNVPFEDVLGVRGARPHPFDEVWAAESSPAELTLRYEGHAGEPEPDTDIGLVRAGYAAATLLTGIAGVPADAIAAATTRAAGIGATTPTG
ncbi:MAG TPA: 5'/3'-nucleotidase SurE [Acidimicrobiia bacterium]|nr:5'/3'-nucleotidase SurE [Acidimicrobiia bacterium]